MSEDVNNIPENMEEGEELDNIVVLNDEDGNEVEFEFLDLIEYEGESYVVLLPTDEDEEILNNVFEIFKDKFKDEFNFVED